uniref:Uncharacterized protein n=1 Tax=Arundo donax TaxID=35708 RepID=A0A0A9GTN7_ARUDO
MIPQKQTGISPQKKQFKLTNSSLLLSDFI